MLIYRFGNMGSAEFAKLSSFQLNCLMTSILNSYHTSRVQAVEQASDHKAISYLAVNKIA